jgi:hypothetical protein
LRSQLPGEGTAADDAIGVVPDALPEPAVGGDDPDRRLELSDEAGDLVVTGLVCLPDDGQGMTVFVSPRLRSLLQLVSRHVRPQGAANVLRVDEDVGHSEVVARGIPRPRFRARHGSIKRPLRPRDPRRSITLDGLVVGACVGAAGTFAAYYSARVITWAVMTDELQTTKLATSIAETGSLVPRIHGEYYAALSQLYPLLIAPFYGLFTPPAAATAAHVLNPFLLASAAWPAYLLAHSVTGSRAAGTVAALLTAFMPWLVMSTTLLTENAAYPAFVWAVLLCQRSIAKPSAKNDVVALAGLLLAFLARTQFFVLAVVLPLALLGHEVTFTSASSQGWRGRARTAIRSHRVLFVVYAVGLLAGAALGAAGRLGSVVGNYALPFEGDLLPGGIWHSAAVHLDYVVVGGGILPFLLTVAWAVTTAIRSEGRSAHAFAWLLLFLVPLLTFEVTSFDLRFTPNNFIQDRYLFYLTPLLAVAASAALLRRENTRARIVALVVAAGVYAWLAGVSSYHDQPVIFWASPGAAFHPAIVTAAGWLHLSAAWFVRLLVLVVAALAVVLVAAPQRARPNVALAVAIALAGFGAFEAGYVFDRFAEPALITDVRPHLDRRDWIDASVPSGSSVELVPSPLESATYWWEAEFWNKDVEETLRIDHDPTFTPFPADDGAVDFDRGRLEGARGDFLVVARTDPRFHLVEAGVRRADVTRLRLVRPTKGYRLEWATSGVSADGWTAPGRETRLRFYGHGRPVKRALIVVLSAAREAPKPIGFTLASTQGTRKGSVDPGGARPPVELPVCVPAVGYTDVLMHTSGSAHVPDGRDLALHFDRIDAPAVGTCHA